mmetsp:Transcript_47437/g.34722  ORF Transcript_47437/g.34722 Transcript_47437/m.34722 type:complete len:104 (+) Transcript_47437:345-656(+)
MGFDLIYLIDVLEYDAYSQEFNCGGWQVYQKYDFSHRGVILNTMDYVPTQSCGSDIRYETEIYYYSIQIITILLSCMSLFLLVKYFKETSEIYQMIRNAYINS